MSSDSHSHDIDGHDIEKWVRVYMMVFVALLVLTVVTVAVAYFELSVGTAIALALVIASVKGSLVACYFMHLINEKKLIYWILLITLLFFMGLMVIPVLWAGDPITYTGT